MGFTIQCILIGVVPPFALVLTPHRKDEILSGANSVKKFVDEILRNSFLFCFPFLGISTLPLE